jgi:hypothetical protein
MKKNMKQLVAVVTRGDKNYWTRIGVAFENAKDRSWTLKFDYLPANLGATAVQLRDFRRAGGEEAEGEQGIAAQP